MTVRIVSSGVVSSGFAISAADVTSIQLGGTTISAIDGGVEYVLSGGLASAAIVVSGGLLANTAGGIVDDATVSSGGAISGAGNLGGAIYDFGTVNGGLLGNPTGADPGLLTVASGGLASGVTVLLGGTEVVESGGSITGGAVSSGGVAVVSAGAVVNGLTVSSGGLVDLAPVVSSGTSLNIGPSVTTVSGVTALNGGVLQIQGAIVLSGGILGVAAGGTVTGATVSAGGALSGPGALQGITFDYGAVGGVAVQGVTGAPATLIVESGGSASGMTVSSAGADFVYAGGTTTATTLLSGGTEYVSSGGATSAVTVSSGGVEIVSNGGSVAGGQVAAGGSATLLSGALVSGVTVSSGGAVTLSPTIGPGATVSVGAAVATTTVSLGGVTALSGAQINLANVTVLSGGVLNLGAGAAVTGGVVSAGGLISGVGVLAGLTYDFGTIGGVTIGTLPGVANLIYVESGGLLSGAAVSGATEIVLSGGVAVANTVIAGGSQNVSAGAGASATIVGSAGVETVSSGGTASGATVLSAGQQIAQAGALVSGTQVSSGGVLTLSSGGSVLASTVSSGGTAVLLGAQISSGASLTATTSEAATAQIGGVTVQAGGAVIFQGAMVASGATLTVAAGAVVSGATIANGGGLSGAGAVVGAIVDAGAVSGVLVGGQAGAVTNLYVQSLGVANGLTVLSGAALTVSSGGAASGTLLSGIAYFAGVDSGTIVAQGAVDRISGGGKSYASVVQNGGVEFVLSGGATSSATISSGGELIVYSRGTVSGGSVLSGGTVFLSSGAAANGLVITSGGVESFAMNLKSGTTFVDPGVETISTTLSGVTLLSGAILKIVSGVVSSGGVLNLGPVASGAGLTVSAGGQIIGAGTLYGTDLDYGLVSGVSALQVGSSGNLQIQSGGVASAVNAGSGGQITVSSGGQLVATVALSGGVIAFAPGASLTGATVNSGGALDFLVIAAGQTFADSGSVSATTVVSGVTLMSGALLSLNGGLIQNGGTATLSPGVVVSGLTIAAGGTLSGPGVLEGAVLVYGTMSGGLVGGPTAGGAVQVQSGGVANGLTLLSGGADYVYSGGATSGTVVSSGAQESVRGQVNGTYVNAGGLEVLYSGGVANAVVVGSGGTEELLAGASGSGVTLLSGATLILAGSDLGSGGGVAAFVASSATIVSGAVVSSGAVVDLGGEVLLAGGSAVIQAGAVDSGSLVSSGGTETVLSGGTATGVYVFSGGVEVLSYGAVASNVTVASGGTVEATFLSTGQVTSQTTISGVTLMSGAWTVGLQGAAAAPVISAQVGAPISGQPVEVIGAGVNGDVVTIYADGGSTPVGSGVVVGGVFDIVTTATFVDGAHSFTARQTAPGGAPSAPSGVFTVYVRPPAPLITAQIGQPIAGQAVEVRGTGQNGETITLYADGGGTAVGSGIVSGGVFDIVTSATFADGAHLFTATQTDSAGLTGPVSSSFTVGVTPAAPAITLAIGQPVSGQPIEVQGTGQNGETITLYVDGAAAAVGSGVVSGGVFDIVTTATFTDGNHTVTATQTDSSGYVSAPSAAFPVPVLPSAPVITAVVGRPLSGQAIEVTGTGQNGDTITLYADGNPSAVGVGVVVNGVFDIVTTRTFTDGDPTLTATQTDGAGLTSSPSASFFVTVYPLPPVISAVVGQPISGQTLEIRGSGQNGDTITLYADGGTTVIGTGLVANGVFDITTSAVFADGNHTITATQTDAVNLVSAPSAPFAVAVAPPAPTLVAQVGAPIGGQAIEIRGTGQNGDTITLYADGGTGPVGVGVVSGGVFDIVTTGVFTEGVHSITAIQTDTAGLSSALSGRLSATVSPAPLSITSVVGQAIAGQALELKGTAQNGDTVTLYADGGSTPVGSGAVTNGVFDIVTTVTFGDGLHNFTATQTNSQGLTSAPGPVFQAAVTPLAPSITAQVGQAISGQTVEVRGTGQNGDTVTLYADGGAIAVGTGVVTGGVFDITTTVSFTDGLHAFTASQTDSASLTSALSARFTASVAPLAPSITGQVGQAVSGQSIEVRGTGQNGETVTLYADGGTVAVGSGVVTGGVFDIITSVSFADGNHSLSAIQTDGAGLSGGGSAAFPVTVIPQAPTITVSVGHPVAGQTVELRGSGQNGDTVTIYANGGSTAVGAGVVANGVFDIVTTTTFLDGVQGFTATQTDLAGVTSGQGASFAVSVAPLTPTVGAVVGQPVSGQAVEVTGTGQSGDIINLYADDGLTVIGAGTVVNGAFDIFTSASFADGYHTVSATQTDAAGLTSAASADFGFSVAPVAPVITSQIGWSTGGQAIEVKGTGQNGDTVTLYADGGSTPVGIGVVTNGSFDIVTTTTFSEGVHVFKATQTDGAGLVSPLGVSFQAANSPSQPTLMTAAGPTTGGQPIEVKGAGQNGETITIYADGGTTPVGSGVVVNGVYDIVTSATFTDGAHVLVAIQTDAFGLSSLASAPLSVEVSPTAPTLTASVGQPVTGQAAEIRGTGLNGETITLYADGGATAVGTGVVSGGVFDITTTATFTDGPHTFTATQTDSAGLTSAPGASFTLNVIPSPPVITGLAGAPVSGQPIEVKGTGLNGETVTIYADGGTTAVGAAIVAGGVFDIITTASFTSGSHSVTATETDAAGLSSAPSAAYMFSLGPATPTIALLGVRQGATPTITATGSGVNGDTVTLYDLGATVGGGVVSGGTFNIITSVPLTTGLHSLTAIQSDASGLKSSQSAAAVFDVLSKGVDNVQAAGPMTIIAQTATIGNGDVITPTGLPSLIYLSGTGTFNLSLPTALTNIAAMTAFEYVGAAFQTITLRNRLDLTVNVTSVVGGVVKIIGASNNDIINLGLGTDSVTIGGLGEVVNGGGGIANITATGANAGALITTHGGITNLALTVGGVATLNAGDTGPMKVTLAKLASGSWTFTANNQTGLVVTDLSNTADTLIAGGPGETLIGGPAGKQTLVGFGSGVTTYKDTVASFNAGTVIQNYTSTDLIDLSNLGFTSTLKLSVSQVSGAEAIVKVMLGATVKASVTLFGQIAASSFALSSDGATGVMISDTPGGSGSGKTLATPLHG